MECDAKRLAPSEPALSVIGLGAGEFLQVEGERVACDLEVVSEISRRRSLRAAPHKVAEDLQAGRLRESRKTGNGCD